MSTDIRQRLVDDGIDPDEKVHGGLSWLELHTAFELIENKENWKLPIDAAIDITGQDVAALTDSIIKAVSFFAGGGADVWVEGNKLRVKAPGYYLRIGA